MDELIEHERAVALAHSTDLQPPDTQRRRRGRWDNPQAGEVSSAVVDGASFVVPPLEPLNETPARKSRWDKPALEAASATKKRRWDVLGDGGELEPAQKTATPTPQVSSYVLAKLDPTLPALRPEDYTHFAVLLRPGASSSADPDAAVAKLLLRIKNGLNPASRRAAIRELSENAISFGAAPILDVALPLLMAPALDAAARHSLVGALVRVLPRLAKDALRPHIHRVLLVAEALLMDEEGPARDEGREIVATLVRTVGPADILATVRADSASADEYVRGGTARIVGIIALASSISSVLPFLVEMCGIVSSTSDPQAHVTTGARKRMEQHGRSDTEWAQRHTGLRAVQCVAQSCGSAVLPSLDVLLSECLGVSSVPQSHAWTTDPLGEDEDPRLRIAALSAIASLAEAAAPHGIASLEPSLPAVFKGLRRARGRTRAAHLRAAAALLPLMAPEQADVFARPLLDEVAARDIGSPDDESRRLALRVLVISSGVIVGNDAGPMIRQSVFPPLFADGWSRRTVLDRRTARMLVDATVAVASRTGAAPVLAMLAVGPDSSLKESSAFHPALRDENAALHLSAVDAVAQIIARLGLADADDRLLAGLTDALLAVPVPSEDNRDLFREAPRLLGAAWDALLTAAGLRARPLVLPLASAVLWRLSNKSAAIRRSGAELASRLPRAASACAFDNTSADAVAKVAAALVENLGEQTSDVLASIVSALGAIADAAVLAPNAPVHRAILDLADLIPRLTPLLRNRAEAVQEAVLAVASRVAEGAPESAGPREWMRICFELIDMLRAQRRSVRRAAVAACGSIARAVGPQDVLSALLTNLRVQERQNRVCTTVAVAIVAERCAPFAVLPALLCEYRVPEAHVQHGVLKALAYIFEHVGPAARPYAHAVAPVLEDALTDRDQVHRQTATVALRSMALALAHYGGDDAVCHVLNAAFPSLLDPDPHVFLAIHDALDAARLVLGPSVVALYLAQGLFHPARRVRDAYWRLWNALYIASAPSLAPLYPQLEARDLCTVNPLAGASRRSTPCYSFHLLDVIL